MLAAVARGDHNAVGIADRLVIRAHGRHAKRVAHLLHGFRVLAVHTDDVDFPILVGVVLHNGQERIDVRILAPKHNDFFHGGSFYKNTK